MGVESNGLRSIGGLVIYTTKVFGPQFLSAENRGNKNNASFLSYYEE